MRVASRYLLVASREMRVASRYLLVASREMRVASIAFLYSQLATYKK